MLLSLCLLSKFSSYFLSSAFFKINFLEKFSQKYHRASNSLDLDQAQHFVRPDLGPNCLQRLSADDTSWQIESTERVFCVLYELLILSQS